MYEAELGVHKVGVGLSGYLTVLIVGLGSWRRSVKKRVEERNMELEKLVDLESQRGKEREK